MDEVTTVTLDLSQPPAVVVAPPAAPVVPSFTGERGNFAADMAALAAELSPTPVVEVPAPVEPVQPATTESATAPVTVPEKFKDADGNPDQAKIEKSTADAQAALTKYLATEKELRRKMNEVSGLKNKTPLTAPTEPAAPQSSFAAQIEADIAKYGAGEVMARLFESAKEVAKAETKRDVLSDVQADREERLEIKSRAELEQIAKFDKEVLTPAGLEALAKIRAERPWIESAANPTSEAYKVYLADQVLRARQTGTVLPNPTGVTVQAKPGPVPLTPRVVVQAKGPDLSTQASIDAHVKGLSPEAEAAFWKSKGLRF